jgi:hypothetical protein
MLIFPHADHCDPPRDGVLLPRRRSVFSWVRWRTRDAIMDAVTSTGAGTVFGLDIFAGLVVYPLKSQTAWRAGHILHHSSPDNF